MKHTVRKRLLVVLACVALGAALAGAAELFAKHMEVVRLPEGQATIFSDSVVITDSSTKILSNIARMYDGLGLAVIRESVHITSPDADIRAESAFYYLNEKRAELYGNVRVHRESLDITAPWLEYRSADRLVEAKDGVVLEDPERKFRMTGERGTYDLANDIGAVDRSPVLTWLRDKDSARVTSREMTWNEKESRAVATGNVKLVSGASEVTCDTVIYVSGPDSGLALGKPQVHDSSSKASGDTMSFHIKDGALKDVTISSNATGEYRTQGGDKIQVEGKVIYLAFAQGDVERIEVTAMSSGRLFRNVPANTGGSE
jgi:lipopolysaccharide export system protein LptA